MRIAIAALNYAPEPTGTAPYTTGMAEWLAAHGHDVTVVASPPHYPEWRVAPSYRGRGYQDEGRNGVRVLRAPVLLPERERVSASLRIAVESTYTVSASRWWLPRLVARERADVAVVICPPLQGAAWPWLYQRARRVPWVLHVQDLQVDAALELGMIRNPTVGRIMRGAEARMLTSAPFVSTITRAMLSRIRVKGVSANRSFLFPNWTDLSRVTPRPPSRHWRQALGAGDDDTLLIHSGNMGEKQGLEVILDAARLLVDRPDVRFAIVGNGGAKSALQAAARDAGLERVVFHDLVPMEELPALLSAGDVHLVVQKRAAADLVMPSKLTNVLAAGRPVIATAEVGTELHTVVDADGTGITVPPEDGEALAAAIARLADDAEGRRAYGAHARMYAERNLDKDVILSRFAARLATIATGVRHV